MFEGQSLLFVGGSGLQVRIDFFLSSRAYFQDGKNLYCDEGQKIYFNSLSFGKSEHFFQIPNIKAEKLKATLYLRDHCPIVIVDIRCCGFENFYLTKLTPESRTSK